MTKMIETKRHIEALDLLYRLGGGAATNDLAWQVAKKMEIGERTFWNWFKDFKWRERMDKRNALVDAELEKKSVRDVVRAKASYRSLIGEMIAKLREAFDRGEIPLNSVAEFEKLIKLDMLLMGEKLDGEMTINIITAIPRPPPVDVIEGTLNKAGTSVGKENIKIKATVDSIIKGTQLRIRDGG